MGRDTPGFPGELGARELAVADAVRHRLLRDRVHGDGGQRFRPRAIRHGAHELLAAPGGRADLRRTCAVQACADHSTHLAADAAAEVVHIHGRLRLHGRHVRQLRGRAGDRYHHPRGCLCARLSAAAGRIDLRHPYAAGEGQERARRRQRHSRRDGAGSIEPALHPTIGDRRAGRAVRQFRESDEVGALSRFDVVTTGESSTAAQPSTQKNIPHRGGAANPSAKALQDKFAGAVKRVDVVWGETTIYIDPASVRDAIRWLHDDATQRYDFLSDVTAVEYRDPEVPIEVVWHLRSLPFRLFLRIKAQLPKGAPLEIDSVYDIYRAADWLERECYDMFGIRFRGHPDLRRLLMWESYKEGYPLRKDFPLRGRFSRSEQLRQALDQNPEARYSMEELTIADAFAEIPEEMKKRLSKGERTGE